MSYLKDKISIIIPVYNVEPYIRKCLDSVINQTYHNLEILLVDDGSTDGSGKICDEYAAKDSRIRVFHKKNGGDGSARNVGLRNFTGQYVGFVDSDDWVEPEMYEALYNLIKNKNVSIGVCGFFNDTDTNTVPRVNIAPIPNRVLTQKEMLLYIYRMDIYNAFNVVIWNKLYSANIFLNNKYLLFNEKLQGGGSDVLFTPSVFLSKSCAGAYLDRTLYHYRKRNTSLVYSSSINAKEKGALTAYKLMQKLFRENGYEYLIKLAKKETCYYASLIAELAIEQKDGAALLRMQKEMRDNFSEYAEVYAEFPERIERIIKLINEGQSVSV